MITVTIQINGTTIYSRSARNTGRLDEKGQTAYDVDTGDVVFHKRSLGAVKLAKTLLDTIHDLEKPE